MQFDDIAAAISSYYPNPDLELVKTAYEFAKQAHAGQVRASGEAYFSHVHETALLVCRLKLDIPQLLQRFFMTALKIVMLKEKT